MRSGVKPAAGARTTTTTTTTTSNLRSCHFEIFGRVQGVFFRKHTQAKASALGLRGFVMNTDHGTVVGMLEGEQELVQKMKQWLATVGSPKSRVEKAVWKEEKIIEHHTYPNFTIRK